MKLNKLTLRSLLAVGALPVAMSGQNLAEFPVPAHLEATGVVVPVFVDPNVTVDGTGTSWADPLSLSQIPAIPTTTFVLPSYQTSLGADAVQIVVKEWVDASGRHLPISSEQFTTLYAQLVGNIDFDDTTDGTTDTLPVVAVRWGYDVSNTVRGNLRVAHSATSVIGVSAPDTPSSPLTSMTGSYQTVLPGEGIIGEASLPRPGPFDGITEADATVLLASQIPSVGGRFLDGVNVQSGRQLPANGAGAGLSVDTTDADPIFVTNSQFTDNFATDLGGAIYIPDVAPPVIIANSVFWANQAERTGGAAIYSENPNVAVYQSVFDTNLTAQGQGGAYYGFAGSDVDFVSNVFFNNNADQQGGAAYLSNNSISAFINNHFVNNTSELNGGALFFAETAEIDLTDAYLGVTPDDLTSSSFDADEELYDFYNNIFIFNEGAGLSTLGGQIRVTVGNTIDLLTSGDFATQANRSYATGESVDIAGSASGARGSDNILGTADDTVIPTVDGDLYNAGITAAVPDIGYLISAQSLDSAYLDFFPIGWTDPTNDWLDVKNDPRVFDGRPEIGAYEIQGEIPDVPPPPKIIYVDDNAPGDENGVHDGNTWESAYLFVQDALMRAELDPSVNEIWIAEAENMEKSHILTREALPVREEFIDAPELYWDGRDVTVDDSTVGTPMGVDRDNDTRIDEIPAWKVPANYCVLTDEFLDEQVRRTAYNPGRRTGLFVTTGDIDYPNTGAAMLTYFEQVADDPLNDYPFFGAGSDLVTDGTSIAHLQVPLDADQRPVRGNILGTLESPKTFRGEPYPVPSYFAKDRYEEISRPISDAGTYLVVDEVPLTYLRKEAGKSKRTIIYNKKDVPFLVDGTNSTIPYWLSSPALVDTIRVEFYAGVYQGETSGLGVIQSPSYQRDEEYDPTPKGVQIWNYDPTFIGDYGVHPNYSFVVRRDLDDRRVVIYGGFDGWRVETADFTDGSGSEVPDLFDPEISGTGTVIEQYEVTFTSAYEAFGGTSDSWTVSDFDRERFLAQRSMSNDTILSGDLNVSRYMFTRWDDPNLNVFNSYVDNRHSNQVIVVESDFEMLSNADRGAKMLESHLQVAYTGDTETDISTVDEIGPGSDTPDPDWSYDEDSTFAYTIDGAPFLFQTRDKHNYIIEQLSIVDAYSTGAGAGMLLNDTFAYLAKLRFQGNRANVGGAAIQGVASSNLDAGAMIVDSCFEDNSVAGSFPVGGAVWFDDFVDVTIINSNFAHNESSNSGGALYVTGNTNVSIHNTIFVANNAARDGGAIYIDDSVEAGIYSSLFTGNNASFGGAISSNSSVYDIMDSVFSGNTASFASAIDMGSSTPYIINTIFHGNITQGIDDPFGNSFDGSGSPIIYDSIITGTRAYGLANTSNIIRKDPMFDDTTVLAGASGLYFYPAVPVESDGCSLVVDRKYDDLTCAEINALKGADGMFGTSDDELGFMLMEGSPAIAAGFDGQDIGIYKDQGEATERMPSNVETVFGETTVYIGNDWVQVPALGNDLVWVAWEPFAYSVNHGWIYPIAAADGIYLWIYSGSWHLFFIDPDDNQYPLADNLLDDTDMMVPLPFTGIN